MFCLTQKGGVDLKISVHDVVDGMNVNENLVKVLDFCICLGLRVHPSYVRVRSRVLKKSNKVRWPTPETCPTAHVAMISSRIPRNAQF